MAKSKISSILGVALDILQFVFAVLVVVLTGWKLTNVDVEGININAGCLLDGSESEGPLAGTRFCVYAIAVGVISMLANVIFGCVGKLFNCVTLNACFASKIVGVVGDTVLAVWWGVAFALFLRRGTAANNLDWPERTARDGVIAAAFGGMAAFALDVIVTVVTVAMS